MKHISRTGTHNESAPTFEWERFFAWVDHVQLDKN